MDKTQTYIRMSDCPEIQDSWNPTAGDCIAFEKQFSVGECWTDILSDHDCCGGDMCEQPKFNFDSEELDSAVWLPLQDQLQEMYRSSFLPETATEREVVYWKICDFRDWVVIVQGKNNCFSMEQLWLAFIMKEKYNKIWDNTNWITDGKS